MGQQKTLVATPLAGSRLRSCGCRASTRYLLFNINFILFIGARKMATPIAEQTSRNPTRTKRGSASVSVSWSVYDRLDDLAKLENSSIAAIISGLIAFYELDEAKVPYEDEDEDEDDDYETL
jgi:hypothetical protein